MTALDGTLVWASGAFGAQVLMRSTGGRVTRVEGAPQADAYGSIDLGRDARGRLVLTYARCLSGSCTMLRDDLRGHRQAFRGWEPAGCRLSTAPVLWRARAAYGLSCVTPTGEADAQRSGLYVRRRWGLARPLPLPAEAVAFGIRDISATDLRSRRAAGVAAEGYAFAFSVGIDGRGLRSFWAAVTEGDTQQTVEGLALGAEGVLWTLVVSEGSDGLETLIYRLDDSCLAVERLIAQPDPNSQSAPPAIDLAVDGPLLLLLAPGRGIVAHAFMPQQPCQPVKTL